MQWLRWSSFSFIILFASVLGASEKFDSNSCFNSSFETNLATKKEFLGIINKEFKISKDQCTITIFYKNIFEKKWVVDICREPIHFKLTSKGSDSVLKRLGDCSTNKTSEFCSSYDELKGLIEDLGLIYAEGQREILTSDHGKIYCSYLLVKKYLEEGTVFSIFNNTVDLYENKKPLISEEPVIKEVEKPKKEEEFSF